MVEASPSGTDEHLSDSLMAVAAALRACAQTVESLAATAESRRDPSPVARADKWPHLMSTSVAARYCGYKTTGGLRKAHFDRKVFPKGRRGGVGGYFALGATRIGHRGAARHRGGERGRGTVCRGRRGLHHGRCADRAPGADVGRGGRQTCRTYRKHRREQPLTA